MIETECLFWLKDPHEVSYFVRNVEMWQNGIKCNIKTLLKCKFNVKNGESLRDQPSQRLMIKCLTIIQIELEFGNVGFWGEGKLEYPEKNPSEQSREPTTNSTHIWIEPGTHWWEASALTTTAPSLLLIPAPLFMWCIKAVLEWKVKYWKITNKQTT